MYTQQQRDHLRLKLLEYAGNDKRITGTAITGSAAAGREDQWSDIDLAFGIGDVGELPSVISDWKQLLLEFRRDLNKQIFAAHRSY